MNKSAIVFTLGVVMLISQQAASVAGADLIDLDGIVVAVFGPMGTDIITRTDLNRPGIDGTIRSLDDQINHWLFYQKAKEYHMISTPDEVDKQLRSILQNNKITMADFEAMLRNAGYTTEDGRQQFAVMSSVNQLLGFKIQSNLIVPEKNVVAYYNEHPEYEDAAYYVVRSFIPFNAGVPFDEQKATIERDLNADVCALVVWSEPFWITDSDLAADKKYITQLQPGNVSQVNTITSGFELFRLIERKERRLKTMDERYRAIVDLLRRPKYEELFNSFVKELRDNATIITF